MSHTICSKNSWSPLGAVHKVRHAIFGQFWTPLSPVTLCHTSRDPPKVRHPSRIPPIFSRPSTEIADKSSLYKFYLNCSRTFLSGGFCPGWFLSVTPSVTIHLLQQKVKHHFKRFHCKGDQLFLEQMVWLITDGAWTDVYENRRSSRCFWSRWHYS